MLGLFIFCLYILNQLKMKEFDWLNSLSLIKLLKHILTYKSKNKTLMNCVFKVINILIVNQSIRPKILQTSINVKINLISIRI